MPGVSVAVKVHPDNSFCDFYGDTVVFDLEEEDKTWLAALVQKIYDEVPACFAEAFPVSSYHMTLHDLSSGSRLSSLIPDVGKQSPEVETATGSQVFVFSKNQDEKLFYL